MYTVTKTFYGYPCAHRQWAHQGHCRFVHGYERDFTITFGCLRTEYPTNFVVDFGDLDWVKTFLDWWFDHTLLISEADPELLTVFKPGDANGLWKLRTLPNPGMEGSAKHVFEFVDKEIRTRTKDRAFVLSVECRENEKNAATYIGESTITLLTEGPLVVRGG